MSLRLSSALHAITVSCALSAAAVLFASGADAQSPAKQCGDEWKTAKAAGTVAAGQKRADFIKECRDRLAAQPGAAAPAAAPMAPAAQTAPANPLKPAPAAPAAEAAKSPAAPAGAAPAAPAGSEKVKKPMSPGMAAFHEREKKCGEEWRTNTDQIKAQTPGITWPKYLSACNKRLKAAGQ
ncbi:MAG: hypothetical protein QOF41_3255 [Methylobacteriaceae bacterium]|nr:hypothetical protein [Methylobacteriaceae bacterium]